MPFVNYQPPIPQAPSFNYYAETFGRLDFRFDHAALHPWAGWVAADIDTYRVALEFRRIRDMKYFSERYNIPGYVSICGLSNVGLTEWLGLPSYAQIPTIILEAVVDAVDRKAKAIQDKQDDARRQMELQAVNTGSSLSLGKPNSTFGRVFG